MISIKCKHSSHDCWNTSLRTRRHVTTKVQAQLVENALISVFPLKTDPSVATQLHPQLNSASSLLVLRGRLQKHYAMHSFGANKAVTITLSYLTGVGFRNGENYHLWTRFQAKCAILWQVSWFCVYICLVFIVMMAPTHWHTTFTIICLLTHVPVLNSAMEIVWPMENRLS